MKKGRILYLEDNPEWAEHIKDLLEDDYDIHWVETFLEAASSFSPDKKFDVAIVDIDIKIKDTYIDSENRYYEDEIQPKGGFMFIRQLLEFKGGYIKQDNIIILSGRIQSDDNSQVLTNELKVAGVFDKGNFLYERNALKELVDNIVAKNKAKGHK